MSRRKAPSLIEIRTADGLVVVVENPPEALLREVMAVIGSHARPKHRPRLVTEQEGNPL